MIYLCLLGMMGILFLVSGWEKLPEKWELAGWKIPFYKIAFFLVSHWKKKRKNEITVPEEKKQVEKLASFLLAVFAGLGFTMVVENTSGTISSVQKLAEIERPSRGEGSLFLPLQVQIEGMTEAAELDVMVSERQYSDTEKQDLLEQAMEELDKVILGENVSPDEVRNRIYLPTELMDGNVSIQWSKEVHPEDAVDEQGKISDDISSDGVILQLYATLVCQDRQALYQRALQLYPPQRTPMEQLMYELEKKVEEEEHNTVEEEAFFLPEKINGKSVSWKRQEESKLGICLLFTLIAAIAVYFGKEQELLKQEQMRERQLIMDFPGLLFQLSMLLEAGLTIQNAFCKIALDYRERKGHECRFVYEEMLISFYEMQSGVSERTAYEDFGRRCGVNCYVKLGTILSGSLQKGAQGLTGILKEDARTAMEVRQQLAKKLGEEAGTRLLLPMILMLLVVLVILMVPAIMSF